MGTSEKYMEFAKEVSSLSDDKHTQVGCLIITPDGKRVKGSNRMPIGCDKSKEERLERPLKYKWIEHAERDAIYSAARKGISLEGSIMFLPWFPCVDCARAIISSGISKLVCYKPDLENPIWGEDFKISLEVLKEGKVEIEYLK